MHLLSLLRHATMAASLAFAGLAHAEIEFVGILATPQLTRFALADTATGHTDWTVRGDTFAGWKIQRFDAKADTLVLARDGREVRVRLKDDAKIQASRLELAGEISFGNSEKFVISRATLQFDQENVFPLKAGITYRITPSRGDDNTVHYAIVIESREGENKVERLSAPSLITRSGQKFALRIGDIEFSFTPQSP